VVERVLTLAGHQRPLIQADGGLALVEVHVERGEVGLQGRVKRDFLQHLLGQRRAVIRRSRLRADQGDPAEVSACP
jgi:hypothetical protein